MHEYTECFFSFLTFGIFQRSMQCMTMSFGTHAPYIQCFCIETEAETNAHDTPFMLESIQFLLHSICHRVTISTMGGCIDILSVPSVAYEIDCEKFGEKNSKKFNNKEKNSSNNSKHCAAAFYSFPSFHFRRMYVIFLSDDAFHAHPQTQTTVSSQAFLTAQFLYGHFI